MIKSFKNKLAEHLFHGIPSKDTRRFSKELQRIAIRKLTQLDVLTRIETLNAPPGNRLERLKGNRADQYSIRINDQWRICFQWTEDGPDAVEVVDYH